MKLTKREKIMVFILGGFLFIYSYFYFILGPQLKTIQAISNDQGMYQAEIERKRYILTLEEQVEGEVRQLQRELTLLSNQIFPKIEQGLLIILLDELIYNSSIHIPAVSFSEVRKEEIGENIAEAITVTLPFEGNYESLVAFLRQVRQHPKKIVIRNLAISAEGAEGIKGNIILDFYSISHSTLQESALVREYSRREGRLNPFDPFTGYIGKIIGELEAGSEIPDYSIPIPRPEGTSPQPTAPGEGVEEYRKLLLHGFEALNMFFVGTPKEVIGQLQLNTNAMEGKHAIYLTYDFLRPRDQSVASVVFEGDKVVLPQQPEKLGIWVYSLEKNAHKIGLSIRDSRGIEHNITLTDEINWLSWNYLSTELPLTIAYPAEVIRIYVQSKDFDNITKGELVFDQFEAIYPSSIIPKEEIGENKLNVNETDRMRYRVQKGDTIFSISKKFYNDYTKRHLILQENNISNPNDIKEGQILLIPIR